MSVAGQESSARRRVVAKNTEPSRFTLDKAVPVIFADSLEQSLGQRSRVDCATGSTLTEKLPGDLDADASPVSSEG